MDPPMSKAFRQGDQRCVEAVFEELMPDGYHAAVKLSADRRQMQVVVMDPEDPAIYVANAQFDYNEKQLLGIGGVIQKQPLDDEVTRLAAEFAGICGEYPAAKAKQEAEQLFKASFAAKKQEARDQEAQQRADEAVQLERDRLLARTDAEETHAATEDQALA